MYYQGPYNKTELLGIDENYLFVPDMKDDSIRSENISLPLTNHLASYWPYILFQDSSGQLREIRNNLLASVSLPPTGSWKTRAFGISVINGCCIAIVLLSTNFTSILAGGYGVAYQNTEGLLSIFANSSNNGTQT